MTFEGQAAARGRVRKPLGRGVLALVGLPPPRCGSDGGVARVWGWACAEPTLEAVPSATIGVPLVAVMVVKHWIGEQVHPEAVGPGDACCSRRNSTSTGILLSCEHRSRGGSLTDQEPPNIQTAFGVAEYYADHAQDMIDDLQATIQQWREDDGSADTDKLMRTLKTFDALMGEALRWADRGLTHPASLGDRDPDWLDRTIRWLTIRAEFQAIYERAAHAQLSVKVTSSVAE